MSTHLRRGYVDLGAAGEGGQLHYRRAGRVGAPVLVLLHQTPSHSAMYAPLMAALADRFDCLALDTPGFGSSDALAEGFSIPAAAAALSAAVRQLHAGPCHWFGHHTGAALALQVAHDYPQQVARLALSGPCLLDAAMRERLPQLAATVPATADGSHLQTLWARMVAKDPEAPLSILQRETLEGAAAGVTYAQAYQAVTVVDTAAQLRALRCPTLVFAGTKDPLYPQLEAAYRLLAHGHKAEIAGARTFICERQTPQVAQLLIDFLGAHDV